MFLNAEGTGRLSYSIAYKLIRRLARRGGIAAADRIRPHSLRHSFTTELLEAGVPLQDVQDAMGHADPRTTRAYDRSRHNLDRHPTYAMAANLRRTTTNKRLAEDRTSADPLFSKGELRLAPRTLQHRWPSVVRQKWRCLGRRSNS